MDRPLVRPTIRERAFQARISAAIEHALTALGSYPDDKERADLFCDLAIQALERAKGENL